MMTAGALLGIGSFFGFLIWLHERCGLPVPVVDVAILLWVTLLAAAILIPAYFGE